MKFQDWLRLFPHCLSKQHRQRREKISWGDSFLLKIYIFRRLRRRWKTPFSTYILTQQTHIFHQKQLSVDSEGSSYFDNICNKPLSRSFVCCEEMRNGFPAWIYAPHLSPTPPPSLSILQKFYYCPRLPLTGTQSFYLTNNFIKILGLFKPKQASDRKYYLKY